MCVYAEVHVIACIAHLHENDPSRNRSKSIYFLNSVVSKRWSTFPKRYYIYFLSLHRWWWSLVSLKGQYTSSLQATYTSQAGDIVYMVADCWPVREPPLGVQRAITLTLYGGPH